MKSVKLDVAEAFEERPYRQCTKGLAVEGIPWLPLVGRNSFLRSMEPSPWHTHRGCIEIVYCRHGMCEYESRGRIYRLMPGRVFVSRPNEAHRMLSNPKGLSTYYLLFRIPGRSDRTMLADEVRFIEQRLRKMPRLFEGDSRTGPQFVRLFRLISQSFENTAERRLRILLSSLSLLMSVIDASENPLTDGGSGRVRALAEEMRAHPEREYPLDALATKIGFSTSSLQTGFKATTGYTPHAYLLKCRIERAQEMLRAGDRKVIEIAEALGFPSPQHFATQFRNSTGMSPREWKRENSGE